MPVPHPRVNYPGVYIQEVESPVHTITPVPTSVTAYVGTALRGPIDRPVLIHSFTDFQRVYGGLWNESHLGYAVSDFFLNGGSDAVVVRVFKAKGSGDDGKAEVQLGNSSGPKLVASNPGAWGNQLCARVDPVSADHAKAIGKDLALPGHAPLAATDILTLTVHDRSTKTTEVFQNVTVKDSRRRIDKVVENQSEMVRFEGALTPVANSAKPDLGANWFDDDQISKPDMGYEATGGNNGVDVEDTVLIPTDGETGMYLLKKAEIFNLLVIPPLGAPGKGQEINPAQLESALSFCKERRAVLLLDPPSSWTNPATAKLPIPGLSPDENAAIYYPYIKKADPLRNDQIVEFPPSGTIAGVIARTDLQRGVWKAAAGLEASLMGVSDLSYNMTDAENGQLNPQGINCLRKMPAAGPVVWGARTTVGSYQLASQWKYLPVRRTALFIEESLYRSTQWAVFEPNDEPLWSQLRLNIGAFMHGLFVQGAFQGQTPQQTYFVKCDATTTTQADIDRGIVNIIVGFAPLKPAEFVVLYIQQIAGNFEQA